MVEFGEEWNSVVIEGSTLVAAKEHTWFIISTITDVEKTLKASKVCVFITGGHQAIGFVDLEPEPLLDRNECESGILAAKTHVPLRR